MPHKIFQFLDKKRLEEVLVVMYSFSYHDENFLVMDNLKNTGLRACLHGGEKPHVGEVTRFGWVTRLSI